MASVFDYPPDVSNSRRRRKRNFTLLGALLVALGLLPLVFAESLSCVQSTTTYRLTGALVLFLGVLAVYSGRLTGSRTKTVGTFLAASFCVGVGVFMFLAVVIWQFIAVTCPA